MTYFIYSISFICFVCSVGYYSNTLKEFILIIVPALIMIGALIEDLKQ